MFTGVMVAYCYPMAGDRALIGYLADHVSSSGAFYGGILVVNEKGLPREFRHTEGINPSRLQRTLYGDALLSSLGAEAMGPVLLRALTKKPSILLIDPKGRDQFGEFVLNQRPAGLLTSAPNSESMFMDQIAPSGNMLDHIQLVHHGIDKSQIFVYVDEGDGRGGEDALKTAQTLMNLKSPFDRVRSVLAQVAEIEESKGRK